MLMFLTLVVGLLFGAQAHAQSSDVVPHPVTKADNFNIPESLRAEHQKLHSDLENLAQAGEQTGEAAQSVADVLENHFAKENEYALPPLSLLAPLSQDRFECSMTEVLKMTNKLQAEMPDMLIEHKEIAAALGKLKAAATAENKLAGVQFAEHLKAHAQEEEEITYPAALLIGLYVRGKATACAP